MYRLLMLTCLLAGTWLFRTPMSMVLSASPAMPSAPTNGNTGNGNLPGGYTLGDLGQSDGYSLGEVTDWLHNNGYPQEAAAITAAADPNTGFVQVYELYGAAPGAADSGTIGLNTRPKSGSPNMRPIWQVALVLLHEWEHCTGAHASSPQDPDAPDPTGIVSDLVCGNCREAELIGEELEDIGFLACDLSCVEEEPACEYAKQRYQALFEAVAACEDAGCQSCCGYGYVPNPQQLGALPPCCN